MNTTSHYKKDIKNKIKKNKKLNKNKNNVKSQLDEEKQLYIKLRTPIIDPKSKCAEYSYNIKPAINTNISEISSNINRISFCIYRIVHCKSQQNVKFPFLQYLLFKYPTSSSSTSDLMVFPFIKKSKNILTNAKKFIKQLINKDIPIEGFIEKNKTVFLFYNFNAFYEPYINKVFLMSKKNSLWWCIMDEICNHKKVITFPIHKSVYELFYKNPTLIYIKRKEKRIEIPSISYYGNFFNFLPMIAAFGQQASSKNKEKQIYFSSFRKAVRYGAWSPLYNQKYIYDEQVSDIDGKYFKGGIIRFAIFLGNSKIINDTEFSQLNSVIDNKSWKSQFQSLFITEVKFGNQLLYVEPEYILKNFLQQTPLSYHEIDQSKLPLIWDENYHDYNIV